MGTGGGRVGRKRDYEMCRPNWQILRDGSILRSVLKGTEKK